MPPSDILLHLLQGLSLIPAAGGSVFSVLCVGAALAVVAGSRRRTGDYTPPVSVLKPVYGVDRGLEANLRSFCEQDYPDFQIVLSLQRDDDPAREMLERLASDYPERVTLAIKNSEPVMNGKVQNLLIGLEAARHEVLVISDSDTRVPPDYLRTIVAPLADPKVGYVCTLYRIARARNVAEKFELLTINVDFGPSLLFTYWTNAAIFCLGASTAIRRADLDATGGMESLAEFLVEDQEMGRRVIIVGQDHAASAHDDRHDPGLRQRRGLVEACRLLGPEHQGGQPLRLRLDHPDPRRALRSHLRRADRLLPYGMDGAGGDSRRPDRGGGGHRGDPQGPGGDASPVAFAVPRHHRACLLGGGVARALLRLARP